MPRGSNRVGVEVEPLPQQATTDSPADLLKAKKAERRARARRRAEEKKLKEASQQQQTAVAVSPELDLTRQVKTSVGHLEEIKPEKETAHTDGGSTNLGRKTTLPTPEADEPVDGDLHQFQQQQSPADTNPSVSYYSSSLEQARAEYGTEEILDVDTYVAALNAKLQREPQVSPTLKQHHTELSLQVLEPSATQSDAKLKRKKGSAKKGMMDHIEKQHKDSPGSSATQDVAATRIQKAIKRKLHKKTRTSFRHSSKVFADLPAPTSEPSLPCGSDPDVDAESQQLAHGEGEYTEAAKISRSRREPHQQQQDSRYANSRELTPRADTLFANKDIINRTETQDESEDGDSKRRDSRKQHRHQDSHSMSPVMPGSSLAEMSPPKTSKSGGNVGEHEASSSGSPPKVSQASRSSSDPLQAGMGLQSETSEKTTFSSKTEANIEAATKIQAWLRGIDGRRRAHIRRGEFEMEMESEALLEVHTEASVRIQAIVRGFLTRRRLDVNAVPQSDTRRTDSNMNKVNEKRKKKKNRRASITAFFKGNDDTPMSKPSNVSATSSLVTGADNEVNGEKEDDKEAGSRTKKAMVDKNRDDNPHGNEPLNEVAEWPPEFNVEGRDEWEELNSVANVRGDLVTHAHFLNKSKLRVFCGTWNMHAKKPQDDLRLWIPLNKYHIIAVGSEECVNSIAKSVVFTSKKQWESLLKETLGDEYVLVASHSLTAIHNIVFVHESVIPLLSNIQSDAVATGLGNQLGNKGGVGIAFSIGRTSFAFVNCHFDAHQQNTEKRNGNFHRINQELKLFPLQANSVTSASLTPSSAAVTGESSLDGLGKTTATRFSLPSPSIGNVSPQPGAPGKKLAISECFDRVFWYGDLNYRINGTRRMVDLLLLRNQHDVLLFNDQLQIEMKKGNVFAHFQEGPLHFRPTYKFDKRSNVYDSSAKQRVPSWTDRILFLSNDKLSDIEILSYRSQMSFQTSDHRPVGAAFQVAFKYLTHRNAEDGGGGDGGDQEFSRVLARGYKPSQAKSEVCAVQ